MKNLFRLCLLFSLCLSASVVPPARAANSFFSLSATGAAGRASVVAPAILNRTPRIEYLRVNGDTNAAALTFYTLANTATVTHSQDSTSNMVAVASVSGFASNDIAVATVADGTSYRYVITATTNTSLTIAGTFGVTLTTAAKFRKATAAGNILTGSGVTALLGNTWNGQTDLPLLVDFTGFLSNRIDVLSGSYAP